MIAKSAAKCPQCGAAKTNAARMVAILVGGAVLALLAWAMWIGPMMRVDDDLDEIERKIRAGQR
jgi:hypothetical protein